MSDLTKKYKIGLEYLRKTGFDHIVRELGVFGVEVFKYKPHSRFDSEKADLPNPCQFGEIVLTKRLMDHYQIKTKVDIARYLRIISIILTNFSLPDEYDNFDIHRRELRKFLQNEKYKSKEMKQLAIREALIAYDNTFSTYITIQMKDYANFADILNLFYGIYEPMPEYKKMTEDQKKALEDAVDKFIPKKKPVDKHDMFGDYDDFDDYEDDDAGTTEYKEPDIMWAYDGLYKDFTDEKLVARLKDDRQRGTLRVSLLTMGIEEHSDTQLKEMLKNETERKKLLLKIQKWHKKTFTK
jgi:hypothetical protein